jgi:hypothetical protein
VLSSASRASADRLGDRTIWSVDAPRSGRTRARWFGLSRVPGLEEEGQLGAERIEDADLLAGGRLAGDDLALLHDPLALTLAAAIRDRGAQALWLASGPRRVPRETDERASGLPAGGAHALDAYVMAWRDRRAARGAVTVAAFVPSAELLAARQIALGPEPLRRARRLEQSACGCGGHRSPRVRRRNVPRAAGRRCPLGACRCRPGPPAAT